MRVHEAINKSNTNLFYNPCFLIYKAYILYEINLCARCNYLAKIYFTNFMKIIEFIFLIIKFFNKIPKLLIFSNN